VLTSQLDGAQSPQGLALCSCGPWWSPRRLYEPNKQRHRARLPKPRELWDSISDGQAAGQRFGNFRLDFNLFFAVPLAENMPEFVQYCQGCAIAGREPETQADDFIERERFVDDLQQAADASAGERGNGHRR